MGFLSFPNLVLWFIFKAWIVFDQFPLQLDREVIKGRENGEKDGGRGDYPREAIIPRQASRGAPSREVYNLVAREARVYHLSIARPAWFPPGYKSIEFGWCPPWRHPE